MKKQTITLWLVVAIAAALIGFPASQGWVAATHPVSFLAIIAGIIMLYFVPWMAAKYYEHPQATAIFVLNLFLGWTFIGWVVALCWACMAHKTERKK